MEFFKPGTRINVMGMLSKTLPISAFAVLVSIVLLVYPGPNYGIDFAGGTEMQLAFEQPISDSELRTALTELGHPGADVVKVSGQNAFIVRLQAVSALPEAKQEQIENAIRGVEGDNLRDFRVSPGGDKITLRLTHETDSAALQGTIEGAGATVRSIAPLAGSDDVRLEVYLTGVADEVVAGLQRVLGDKGPQDPERVEWVGPKAGAQLRDAAAKSLLFAIALIMVYVAFRFDLRFAPGGIIALFHDAMITLGVYVIFGREIGLTTVAAILTVIGYSINDTIVVYDRIRENMQRHNTMPLGEIINLSTSQTLGRTIITSGTTLLSIAAFFIWGTPVVKDLAFALFVGIGVGTYSSVFIAAPMTEWIDRKYFAKAKPRKAPVGHPKTA